MDDTKPPGFHCFQDPLPQRAVAHVSLWDGAIGSVFFSGVAEYENRYILPDGK